MMKATNRKVRLALLASAVLIAALAVGAAVLFRANDKNPDAPTAIDSADPTKVDSALNSTKSGAQQEKPTEISPRLAKILQIVYDRRGYESNPEIREWMEWYGNNLIARGEEDADIGGALDSSLWDLRKIDDPKEMERRIEEDRENALYEAEDEDDGWQYSENFSEKKNRINKFFYDLHGAVHYPMHGETTPREVIDILVEGMDDLTAAKRLLGPGDVGEHGFFSDVSSFPDWGIKELEYAAEYADRVLGKDPTSRDALVVKILAGVDVDASSRLIVEHHSNNEDAMLQALGSLWKTSPEFVIAAIQEQLPKDGSLAEAYFYRFLGRSYERLDMLSEASDQYLLASLAGDDLWEYNALANGKRTFPSIWEERAAAAAEASQQAAPPAKSPAPGMESPPVPRDMEPPHDQPDAPGSPDAPRPEGAPSAPPPGAEMDMAAAYANFAKAYQSMFEMEYGLSEATPEGYMNALLEMARAFARAGDAQHAQDAYNAVRKRHSREEVEQVFRRLDERERLKRQPPSEDEEEDE